MLDDQTITLKCPKCSHEITETVGRLKHSPKLVCPSCASNIQINASSLLEETRKVDVALEALRQSQEQLRQAQEQLGRNL